MSARTDTSDALTASAMAVTSENLLDLAVATMEWEDTVGMLSLLQRDAASTTFQLAFERDGAFLGVDDGVGEDQVRSVIAVPPPGSLVESSLDSVQADLAAERLAQEEAARAERRTLRQAQRRAEREAEQQAQRRAARQAERRAEREARRQAERRAERRAERAPDPGPSTSGWNNAPHVTWYGPGFYGNRTACGQTYTREIIGVAHKTLPCGTMVQFRWNGITATAPVIDRGPYGPADYIFDFSAALSCDVFKPKGVSNGCFTRENVAWRVVSGSQ